MKPKKLQLKNFGPFIDETIEFSKLTEAPLFLITGKTGAGKTTIFDGMTYALFGETSGRIRTGKEMRSLFATPEEETRVFFSFEHQRMSYEIERKPEQVLAKRKGEGNRKQVAKVSLTIFDEKGKELRQFTKRSEVDQLIKELMNLDAKQFSQIVLLPQGEFRNFLISSSSEKEIVLRNLFGSQFFQQLNEQLKEKSKNQQKTLDHLEQELLILQKRFISVKEEVDIDYLSFDAMLDYWHAEQAILEESIMQEQAVLSKLQEQQKQIENTYYQSETLKKRYEEKARLIQKQQELFEQENEIKEKKQWIAHYEFAQKLVDSLTRRQEYQTEQIELGTKEKAYFEQLATCEQAYIEWEKHEPQRLNVQKEIEQGTKALQEKQLLIPIAENWQNKQIEMSALQEEKQKLQEKSQKIIQEQLQIQEEQKERQKQLADQESLHEDLLQYEKLRQKQEKYQESLKEWEQTEEQLKMKQKQLIETTKQLQKNQVLLSKQTKQVDSLKSQWASQQIARLQLLLLPGEPCPVCGSIEHPLQSNNHDLPEKEDMIELEKKLAEAETMIEQTHQKIGHNEADEAKANQQIIELSRWSLEQQEERKQSKEMLKKSIGKFFKFAISEDPIVSLEKINEVLVHRTSNIAQAKITYQELEEKLVIIGRKLNEVEQQITQNNEKLQQIQGEVASLSKQLEKIEIETLADDLKQLEELVDMKASWLAEEKELGINDSQKIKLLQAQLETVREQQEKNETKFQDIQTKIANKLLEQQYFKETDDILSFAKQTAEYKQNCQLIVAYDEERLIVKDRLSQLETVSLEENLQDLSELKAQLAEIKEEVAKQQESCYRLQEQKLNNQKIIEEFSFIYQKSQEQLDDLSQLQQLSQIINGENLRKTSLERYVLQVYLQEVLQVANSHLQRLTKNRYQFELAEEVGSYRGKTGLEINIYDDEAGMARGAHTLSGGESFIAALSLALALAEVIQAQTGGVTIEALFIDEGFGSLDEEALEMAIEALETIESEGRMIGIISHVRELKERVVQQIRIDTEGSGQSKVRYHLG